MKQRPMTCLFGTIILICAVQTGLAFYNPETGRWLNRDPIEEKGGKHLYGFVRNNPISLWDRLGKKPASFIFDAGTGKGRVKVNPNLTGALICSGGFLLFSVHFAADEDDQGNNYLKSYGVSATFDGNSSPLENVERQPISWDHLYTLSLPFCPRGPQKGTTTFVLSITEHPTLMTIVFNWKYACNCLCLVNDPLKFDTSISIMPPLFPDEE